MTLRLAALVAALFLPACSGGGGSGAVAVLFQVTAITPQDAADDVGLSVQVILFFNRPVDPATVNGSVEVVAESGDPIPGTLSTSALNPNQVRFTPVQNYFAFAQHFVRVARVVRDSGGALLDRAYEFVFQTEPAGPTLPGPAQVVNRGDLLALGRWFHRMTRLPDGTFLLAGGYLASNTTTDTGEILDPVAGTSTLLTGRLTGARAAHVQVALVDGKVLLAGGESVDQPFTPLTTCEIFDPATGEFEQAASMGAERSLAHGVRLADGRVLVSGGQDAGGSRDDAEIYDPAANTWSPVAGLMDAARATHGGALLANGDAILVGGTSLASATRFTGNGFVAVAPPQFPHVFGAATVLPDGRAFVAGDLDATGVSIFDEANGFLGAVNRLPEPRAFATATAFADGRVLIAGGFDRSGAPLIHETMDLFFPIGSTGRVFRVTAVNLPEPTSHHAAARDLAGAIWITGSIPTDLANAALRQVTVVLPD